MAIRPAAVLALLAFLAAPAALAQTAPISPGNGRAIAGEWRVVRVAGVERLPAPAPALRFRGRDFVGGDGCNHIGGRLAPAGAGRIAFGNVIATRMACEPATMRAADAFHRALKAARIYRIDGDAMHVADARGDVVMVLKRRK